MSFDGKQFGAEIVQIVKDHLERNLSPMTARIEQLESRILLLEAQAGTTKVKPTIRIAAGSGPAT
ncbi:hypothetical protein [Rhizobium ruizarguesonis]|uniref:Transposase n=1 Tax=Rhizobium ruizarguesonis TaxID=2081791 RepID=A0AB38I6U5_9HYPH|nr:hypothetical protein [Rhizobium ruizarguesonis]NEI28698.1 hypothetical protein [Rhizobium ruizarguesonis]TAY93510.1 hypothetical protein ELH85_10180 [Rhizobium ruizarguesonis]TAZ78148.1 hypothetical protein ELH68_10380 [Rhizobium ruizarguesonis]TBA04525.1 hypothetical protein ELH64_08940 [Rhizobium ruizarguesonis]TBA25933.1 hypothetical protein ELH61_09075 [Rhizobium ruizarguesonis]